MPDSTLPRGQSPRTQGVSEEDSSGTIYEASVDAESVPRIAVESGEDRARPRGGHPQSDFAVVSMLGEGGMGRVLLARQRSLSRDVALKTLKPLAEADATGALLREARITGALEHPGIVPIHLLALDEGGRPMLVMKRVDGVDFETLLSNDAHPAWNARGRSDDRLAASLEILVQVCRTLEFAHSRGIIHRDVKPQNIMVGSFGEVYLLDWGIALETSSKKAERVKGTPTCMPPEMALGMPIDQRTDVYLLGATLHVILTGKPRHQGATLDELLHAAALSSPVAYPESVPAELAALCNRATAQSPADRPPSVGALREEITAFLRHRSSRALDDAALERLVELETLLAASQRLSPEMLAQAYRLVTEARFGLGLNLRAHPNDPAARNGMRRCLTLAIELELRQERAEAADVLLREMDVADAELAKRIEEARERSAAFSRDRQRLEHLASELDPTQHSWKRGLLLMAFWFVAVIVGRTITLGGHLSPERITIGSAVSTMVFGLGLLVVRRRYSIFWNAFNRRLISLIGLSMFIIVTHRLVGILHRTPVHETMTIDLIVSTGVALYAAYAFLPRLVLAAIPLLVGIPLALAWPLHAPFIFVVALATATPIAAVVVVRVQK